MADIDNYYNGAPQSQRRQDLMGFNVTPPADNPPSFNVTPGFKLPTPMGWLPANLFSSLAASLTPPKQSVAETLGAPIDAAGWMLHKMGLPVPGGEAPPEWQSAPFAGGKQPWIPSTSVPLGSRNIRAMLDNPPSMDALLQAMLRTRP